MKTDVEGEGWEAAPWDMGVLTGGTSKANVCPQLGLAHPWNLWS